ncbi:LacI family DNA-binding transcriptional regulator [Jonesiaceae bacterium BS-20]|uniref:LacI family DNA-binding transcriptional regulator n=1 Tax=Jonesiaceae bacterium BS-20 TaxID=3120821 RepID=A0AAU7DW41_9MICO
MATLRDVAILAGVSNKTVSNVVNGSAPVRPETKARVESAIAELGYRPNLAARTLRAGRTGVIGLAVPDLSYSYFAELASAVLEVARDAGYVVLIEQTGGNRQDEIAFLTGPRTAMMDGLIFSPLGLLQEDADAIRVPYPLVLLGERTFQGSADHVLIDNVAGARLATQRLIASGKRRIAAVGMHGRDATAGLRLQGYREALDLAGIAFDESLVVYQEMWHRKEGAQSTESLIVNGVPFDAIFALNDELALGALRVLVEHQIQVPEQVALVGFDNVTEGQFASPSLSTIDPHRSEVVRVALGALLERISGEFSAKEPRSFRVAADFVQRESTLSLAE